MNVKKSLENRLRGWLPKEPYNPYKGSTEWALPKARFSAVTKFRIVARVIIGAIFLPLLAVASFSNLPQISRITSVFIITLTMFAVIFVADTIIVKRYRQKTPAEVEKF